MHLKLTFVRSDGSSDDIAVTTDASASIEEVARAIADRDPSGDDVPAGRRLTLRRLTPEGETGVPEWVPLPPGARIGEDWLASGAHIALADAEATVPAASAAAVEVLSGRLRGERWVLRVGTSIVGRDRHCDVVLADPYVSGRHIRVEVSDEIEVVDLGSANGLEVDGELVSRASFPDRGTVTVGDTALRIVLLPRPAGVTAEASRRAGGPVPFNRSPRVEPRYTGESFTMPAPPVQREPNPLPWLAMAAPVLLGIVLAALMSRPILLLFALMSPIMLLGNVLMHRARDRRTLARSIGRFEERLAALSRDVEAACARERETRLTEAPSADEVVHAVTSRGPLLWTRRPEHWSFLNVRLGVGAMPTRSGFDVPGRGELIPELQERVDALVARHRFVPEVPVVDNLHDAGAIGIAGRGELAVPVVAGLAAQLVGLHSPAELCVAAIVTPWWAEALEWLKWVPHSSSPQSPLGGRPHLADTPASASALLASIEDVVAGRLAHREPERRGALRRDGAAAMRGADIGESPDEAISSGTRSPIPAVVLFVSQDAPADRARLVRLSEIGPDAGVYPIWVGEDVEGLPAACRTVVEIATPGAGAVSFVRLGERVEPVRLERIDRAAAAALGRSMAPVADAGAVAEDASDLPRTVAQSELMGRRMHETAEAVIDRWRENDSIADRSGSGPRASRRPGRLRALVGVAGGEAMHLDLRAEGPHALVGGTTGAGKSEFLQAWVLGMAAEYAPDRVTFLFVDYKGGSAFADCVRLPHCVGLVTDLRPALVRRALTSLRAELRHREELLGRRKAKDLLELERRGDAEAPPALVLVIDEFAALAKEVPEFVDGVLDIAQRGRSLGLHLIMATQRPAGVIRDSIRANTNLRVALRVADEADSRDVVGVPDAAHFDPGIPGRAMAKTGPGRLRRFQAAYAGGWTQPGARGADVAIAALRFGQRLEWHSRAASHQENLGELGPNDQQRLVASIARAAESLALPLPRRPWLDELPPIVDLTDLLTSDDAVIPLGLADEPGRQRRSVVAFRPDGDGHIAFFGTGGSGKSLALRSLALATAVTSDGGPVHVYGLDFAGGGLRMLQGLPHVGAVIPAEDGERLERLLHRIRSELTDRARRYSAASAADIVEYRRRTGRPAEPRILLLIDGFPAFRDDWESALGRAACYDVIKDVFTGGRQLGIHIALTADRPGSVPGSASANVQCRVVLRLADESGYGLAGAPKDLIGDESPPGRGIVGGLEVQLGVLGAHGTRSTASDQAERLEALVRMRGAEMPVAPAIESLPELVRPEAVPARVGDCAVLGIGDATLGPIGFEPAGLLLLAGPPGSGRSNALAWLVESVRRLGDGRSFAYLGNDRSALSTSPILQHSARRIEEVVALARRLAERLADESAERVVIIVEGIAEFVQTPAEQPLVELARQARRGGHLLIAENETAGWAGSWPVLAEIKNARRGLVLQPGPSDGELLLRTTFPRTARPAFPPGRGMWVERGIAMRVQLPHIPESTGIYPHIGEDAAPRRAGSR